MKDPGCVARSFKIWDPIKTFSCLVTQCFGNCLRKKANLIKASFSTKKGPDLAFLRKNFQDQMAYGFHFPKESLWNQQSGEGTPRSCFPLRPQGFLSYLEKRTVFQ